MTTFQEVTLRGEAAERRRLDEIEAARQKRIRWEAAMEEARVGTPRRTASGTSKPRKRHGATPPG
ncbi:hypothetical protein [Streptomyces sp. NPDC058434]|uniref:hypothetical protein n=1 Tax=Streptomyces sp. NPDC058434 TaxID=3346498 RepID=UPI0036528AA5